MADIPASAVASLRARTGVSMMECKKALEEANGDEEQAIDILRKKGEAQVVKKADREQKEGYTFATEDGNKVALISVHCETDFVSRGEPFQKLGATLAELTLKEGTENIQELASPQILEAVQTMGENITLGQTHVVEASTIGTYVHTNGKIGVVVGLEGGSAEAARDAAMHAAAMNPLYTKPEEVSAETVDEEKVVWTEQLKAEGKPEEIIEKILMGKEKKFREEHALLTQPFVKDPSQTVGQYLGSATVTEYLRVSIA